MEELLVLVEELGHYLVVDDLAEFEVESDQRDE